MNRSNSFKLIFTVLTLFFYQENYCQTDPYAIEGADYINIETLKIEENDLSNFNSKEKRLISFEPSVNDATKLKDFNVLEKDYTINFPKFHLKYIDEFHANIQNNLKLNNTKNVIVKQKKVSL